MFNLERWEEIFDTLNKNKLRTLLTSVSVASGLFILILLIGVSNGIKIGVSRQFEDDATNKIKIRTGRTTIGYNGFNPGRKINLLNSDYTQLSTLYSKSIEHKSPLFFLWNSLLSYKNESGNYRIHGVTSDMQFIENANIVNGRYLNYLDYEDLKKNVVIGGNVQRDLFKKTDPIGEFILIKGVNFKVVGVFSDPGGQWEENRVFIPISTAQKVFNGGNKVRNISYTIKPEKSFNETVRTSLLMEEMLEEDVKRLKGIHEDDVSAVKIQNSLDSAKKVFDLIDAISAIFWFIGIGTLISGIVGVGNIMVVVVKERTREIGVRKAIGAQPISIVLMILQETIFITFIAGFIGLVLGVLMLEILGPYINNDFILHPQVNLSSALITLLLLVLSGVAAGFVPAFRAANIKPIEALRHD